MLEQMSENLSTGEELARTPPGPALAHLLDSIDPTTLNGHQLITLMQAWARQRAHTDAGLAAAIYQVLHCPPGPEHGPPVREALCEGLHEFASCEISAALHLTRTAVTHHLALATGLHDWPTLAHALRHGHLDAPRARIITDAVIDLPPPIGEAIVNAAVQIAPNLTSGQLRTHLAKLIITTDPDAAKRRYHQGTDNRTIVHGRNRDGTAYLSGCDLPVDQAAAAHAHIGALATHLKRGGDHRTLDQLRADLYLDLLTGHHPTNPTPTSAVSSATRGTTDIVVSITTLMGLDQNPGQIPGWGPVLADIARHTATSPQQTWRYRLTDPHGRLLHTGPTHNPATSDAAPPTPTTRRRTPPGKPSTATEYAFVKARDQHCRYPGCRVPARACDIDHTIPRHRGGPDVRTNMSVLCRHHHRAKDEGGYHLRQLGNGTLQWTTPLDHTYHTHPDPPI